MAGFAWPQMAGFGWPPRGSRTPTWIHGVR